MNKLLPCPFCGSKSVMADHRDGTYAAACSECGAEGPAHFGSTHVCDIDSEEAKAITAWNTRHTPEGWQLVPVEATDDMAWDGHDFTRSTADAKRMWRSMLAAAPKWGGE